MAMKGPHQKKRIVEAMQAAAMMRKRRWHPLARHMAHFWLL